MSDFTPDDVARVRFAVRQYYDQIISASGWIARVTPGEVAAALDALEAAWAERDRLRAIVEELTEKYASQSAALTQAAERRSRAADDR